MVVGAGRDVANGDDWISDSAIEDIESDRLGHRHLVESLADLILRGPANGNIGVFGPWGSGKSSVGRLLRGRLEASRKPQVKFVYFDAWKYQETPLRRHFLQSATEQLKSRKAGKRFTDRMYKRRRTTDVNLSDTSWGAIAAVLVGALIAVVILYGVLSLATASVAALGGRDFGPALVAQFVRSAPTVLLSTAILAPLLSLLLNRWQTTWEESEPSSAEQFDRAFRDLIREALDTYDRVVFFIDELDRAPATAVVSTLETMKTFLGVDGCIFVVAADQLVLEAAVRDQGPAVRTPDPHNPYYSTGSAYLDKIFGYRLHIPPLPASRLSPYARELVASRNGTWAAIRPFLDDVLSLLVPFHILSPRRVKVLLNNYALAYRSVDSNPSLRSRLDDRTSVVGLAKLVCLKTEFPLFYRALESSPRLMRAATEALEDENGAAVRYEDDQELWQSVTALLRRKQSPDVMLHTEGQPRQDVAQDNALSDQLLDYLRLSSEITDFDPEIFYLEARGEAVGLTYDQAHSLMSAAFRGDLDAVAKAMPGNDGGDTAAIRYLASLAAQALGAERRVVLQALLRSTSQASPTALRQAAITVIDYLEASRISSVLRPQQYDSYLRVLEAGPESRRAHGETAVLRFARSGTEEAAAVVRAFDRFTDTGKARLAELASSLTNEDPDFLVDSLEGQEPAVVEALMRNAARMLANRLRASEEPATRLAVAVIDRLSPAVAWAVLTPSVAAADDQRLGELEELVRAAPQAPATVPPIGALLRAISVDPTRRSLYASRLPHTPPSRPIDPGRLIGSITSAIRTASESDEAKADSTRVIEALKPFLEADRSDFSSGLRLISDELSVPYGGDLIANHGRQHDLLRLLASLDGRRSAQWIRILADSGAALLMSGQPIKRDGQELFSQVVAHVTRPPEDKVALQHLEQVLKDDRAPAAAGVFTPDRRRYELALVQRSLMRNAWPLTSNADDNVNAARRGTTRLDGRTIAVLTDAIRPAVAERPKLIRAAILRAEGNEWDAAQLEGYFTSLSEQEAMQLMQDCLAAHMHAPAKVLSWIAPKLTETKRTKYLVDHLQASTRNEERNLTLGYLRQVNPQARVNQRRVADAVVSIADRESEGSFKIAARWAGEMIRDGQLGDSVRTLPERLMRIKTQRFPNLHLPERTSKALESERASGT